MKQSTHAWLAIEAYRKIHAAAKTDSKLKGLDTLLSDNLGDVVVAAWLPDSLIKDMQYGHVFKVSKNNDARYTLSKKALLEKLPTKARVPAATFGRVDDILFKSPFRVKKSGGHLPARVAALCQSVRDMFYMGDDEVYELTKRKKPEGRVEISKNYLFSSRDIAITMWMLSHYIADAHMPFHCDNRGIAYTDNKYPDLHTPIEALWDKQMPKDFNHLKILRRGADQILDIKLPEYSLLKDIDFGNKIGNLVNSGDPWLEAVYICRASFVASYAIVPYKKIKTDDMTTAVKINAVMDDGNICGEKLFWEISRAIMHDAADAIARFWKDAWISGTKNKA